MNNFKCWSCGSTIYCNRCSDAVIDKIKSENQKLKAALEREKECTNDLVKLGSINMEKQWVDFLNLMSKAILKARETQATRDNKGE